MAQPDLFQRFKAVISAMKEDQPGAVANALDDILNKAEEGQVIVKYDLQKVVYDFNASLVSLNVLRCPRCGRLFEGSVLKCPDCDVNLHQAYVGVPLVQTGYHGYKFSTNSDIKLVVPITIINETKCRYHRGKLKALKPRAPMRPLQSLAFACPFNDRSCQYYDNGWCTEGLYPIYFPHYKGLQRGVARPALAKPSVNITKPFTVTVFPGEPKQGTGRALSDLSQYMPVARETLVGEFTVTVLTIMYLLGHPYSGRYRRLPVFQVDSQGRLIFLGRKLETEGLLIKLDYDLVEEIVKASKSSLLTVAHSISHVILLALTRLTGLSPSEFGEAVFVDKSKRVAEILIYDNSPGGIGGVKTAANDVADFVEYICNFSRPCQRMCRSACRACVFYETCAFGNMFLSWRAAEKAVDRSACLQRNQL